MGAVVGPVPPLAASPPRTVSHHGWHGSAQGEDVSIRLAAAPHLLCQGESGGISDSRAGVGHGTHHSDTPSQGSCCARCKVLLVGATRLTQVDVDIDQAWGVSVSARAAAGHRGYEGRGRSHQCSMETSLSTVPVDVPSLTPSTVPVPCCPPGATQHPPGRRMSFWDVMQSTCIFSGGAAPIWPSACRNSSHEAEP